MNYGHRTGYNLLRADAEGIISPDILLIVHKAKGKLIYLKQFPHSCICYGSRKVVPFPGTERTQLHSLAAPKPGLLTWFPEQLTTK